MGKWWPSIVAAVTAVAAIFSGAIQADIAKHPAVSAVLALVYAVMTHVLPSPVTGGKE